MSLHYFTKNKFKKNHTKSRKGEIRVSTCTGRAIAQAVSRWLPTAAVRGSKPDLGMWDLW
jgi:hypothetical protein